MTFGNSFVRISLFLGLSTFFLATCGQTHHHQGQNLYGTHCASCHMEDGTGLAQLIPPLAGADYLAADPLASVCITRYGIADTIRVNGVTYNQPMAGIEGLTEFQITNIVNYVNQAWGNDYGDVTLAEVRQRLEECPPLR